MQPATHRTTEQHDPQRRPPADRSFLATTGFASGVGLTAVWGLLVGWGQAYLQFFGETASGEDYEAAAGGYGTAAALLLLALPGIVAFRAARWMVAVTVTLAALLTVFALDASTTARETAAADPGEGYNSAWDGMVAALAMPWTWLLALAGLVGAVRLVRSRWSSPAREV